MKSQNVSKELYPENENFIEQPTKESIETLCKHLKLPFTQEMAISLIYGDNKEIEERVLPEWLQDLKFKA